jgi:hypothetical protein
MTLVRGVVDRFLRRSGSRVSILNACRQEVPIEHSASAKPLYPLGQPKKALGHEPQIDLCVANQATATACQLQKPIDSRRYSIKMQSRWNHARPAAGLETESQKPTARITNRGLEVTESLSPSGRGTKMSLTSPLIDQAIVQVCAFHSHETPVLLPDIHVCQNYRKCPEVSGSY